MILIAGDSFTAETKFPIWHDHLINPKHKRINLASSNAGNLYIGESVKRLLTSKVRAFLSLFSFGYKLTHLLLEVGLSF